MRYDNIAFPLVWLLFLWGQMWATDTALPALESHTLLSSSSTSTRRSPVMSTTSRRVTVRALYDAVCFVLSTVCDCVAGGGADAECLRFLERLCGAFTSSTTTGAGGGAVCHCTPPPHVDTALLYSALRGDGVNEVVGGGDRSTRLRSAASTSAAVQATRLALQVRTVLQLAR